jgi:hypothetical protein
MIGDKVVVDLGGVGPAELTIVGGCKCRACSLKLKYHNGKIITLKPKEFPELREYLLKKYPDSQLIKRALTSK